MLETLEKYQAIKQTTELSGQIINLFGDSEPDFEMTTNDLDGNEVTLPISKLREMHENAIKLIEAYEAEHPEVLE